MHEWNAETAEWYAEKYGEYATNRLAVDAIEVQPDAVVVDVGCGTGSALRRISPRVPQGRLVGIDPIPRMLEIARERATTDPNGPRIEFHRAPAEQLPLADDFADLVFAFDSFDHWQDKSAGLNEIKRVLRPGGRFVVVKDGGIPSATAAKREFLAMLDHAGFLGRTEQELSEDDVACTMWIFSAGRP